MNRLSFKQLSIFIGIILLALLIFQLFQNKSDKDEYQAQIDVIVDATNKWISDHESILDDEKHMTINLYLLKQDGYIKNNFKNPNTRSNFSNSMMISIVKKKDKYNISVHDDVEELNDDYDGVDVNAPRILLRGDYILYTEINKTFNDPGVIAYNSEGGDVYGVDISIEKDDVPVRDIDVSELSEYNVKYMAEYVKEYSSIHRTVIVRDTKAPKIDAPKLEITLDQVDGLDLMSGVTVTDNSNQDVDVSIEGSVSKNVGKYLIVYKAVDLSGNETTKKRVVRVYESYDDIPVDDGEEG